MNWRQPIDTHYNPLSARTFQNEVRKRFARLAACIGWTMQDYDLYTKPSKGSDHIYLHHDNYYLALYPDVGVLAFHTCRSRRDHHGRPVALMRLDFLDDIPNLASKIHGAITLRRFTGEMRPVTFALTRES
ncbi:hypothetical protein [Hyphomicrobium sp.]|jgi:hypothetical protein|uniref:hypothetical protein n=1 Tax=Hyphomicrobium sp. TaxID=82 RepID=UPI0035631767